ncbi:glycosyltransferase family 61 protein [Pontibacter diazotrophicus]|uniref:Glycosyltransferase family 61 protein n=1 Tax=Pontibacter diazotrophicus TaxID=1400979 RepID=A0A3D8LC47_9BACT|nr:glycosyltransferase family 61 protein [Pontibacter diazotrophicus]RDV14864.1 glycosyltransferase family 61 protein [Pontibacter diazotrophicus]
MNYDLKLELRYQSLSILKYLKAPFLKFSPTKEVSIDEYLKKNKSASIQNFEENESYILTLLNGRVWSSNGTVITEDNILISEINRTLLKEKRNSVFYQKSVINPQIKTGVAAIVAQPAGNVYYHWMIDILPRIELLKKADEFDSIDYFVFNEIKYPFQKETLKIFGIPENKIIEVKNLWNYHFQFDKLIFPSFTSELNRATYFTIKTLEKYIYPKQKTSQGKQFYKKIYLSRSKAPNRKLLNEQEVLCLLKAEGFYEIFPEEYSVIEQAEIFANAEVIVGVHGSAFTNIAFCKPATKVIDICAPEWVNDCFLEITKLRGLVYIRITGNQFLGIKGIDKGANISLHDSKIKFLMEQV